MSNNLTDLQSRVPTPISIFGNPVEGNETKQNIYKGEPLPLFIHKHGGDFTQVTEFLKYNKLGSPFQLQEGDLLVIPQK